MIIDLINSTQNSKFTTLFILHSTIFIEKMLNLSRRHLIHCTFNMIWLPKLDFWVNLCHFLNDFVGRCWFHEVMTHKLTLSWNKIIRCRPLLFSLDNFHLDFGSILRSCFYKCHFPYLSKRLHVLFRFAVSKAAQYYLQLMKRECWKSIVSPREGEREGKRKGEDIVYV